MSDFLQLAWRADVRQRALKVAGVVGTILVAINQGDAILAGSLSTTQLLQIGLTYCVPYCVSSYSSVKAIGP
ncbi:MAG: hypothetical protein GKR90_11590 [Pseudomonadales bacterium]|nr:hypothetical protein [Pseudomonadales bacterium]